jgi:hypothetical protein
MSGYAPPGYNEEEWDKIRKKIYKRDDYTCQACGVDGVEVHAVHKTPRSKGGSTTPENLYTLCADCHDKKYQHEFDNAPSGISGRGAAGSTSQAASGTDVFSRFFIGLIGVLGAMWSLMMLGVGAIGHDEGGMYISLLLAGPITLSVCLVFILYGLTGYMPSIRSE